MRAALLGALAAVSTILPAAAQDTDGRLQGRVLGPEGEPVAGAAVALHRITDAGGADLASVTTDEDGAFVFDLSEAPSDAVQFAAVRYRGSLFVGPMVEGSRPAAAPYEIRLRDGMPEGAIVLADGDVLPPATAGGAGMPLATGSRVTVPDPPSPARAAAVLFLIFGAGAGLAVLLSRRGGRRRRRELLVQIALLDEKMSSDEPSARSERSALLRERSRLLRLVGER